MKRIPNLLSASRIVLCLPLLLVDAMTLPFWVLYLIAGLTDILDGFLARRWGIIFVANRHKINKYYCVLEDKEIGTAKAMPIFFCVHTISHPRSMAK